MIKHLSALALLIFAAAPVAAKDLVLTKPIDCTLGQDCYIQQYFDHDTSDGASDYRCAPLTYNKHRGTDFALRSIKQMQRGVDVVASAPGTVLRLRDTMPDISYSNSNAETVSGRECGNSVAIGHGDGWETQYCHMKKSSIAVKRGQRVDANTVLGQVGLSGRTQFPHVHLIVRKDGKVIDPFDPDGQISCGRPDQNAMWQTPLPYQPGGILSAGFHDSVPTFSRVKSGRAALQSLAKDVPAIVVFGYAFGTQKGDQMHLVISGPNGDIIDHTEVLKKNQAFTFRAAGKSLKSASWPTGVYTGSATLIRGGRIINIERTQTEIR